MGNLMSIMLLHVEGERNDENDDEGEEVLPYSSCKCGSGESEGKEEGRDDFAVEEEKEEGVLLMPTTAVLCKEEAVGVIDMGDGGDDDTRLPLLSYVYLCLFLLLMTLSGKRGVDARKACLAFSATNSNGRFLSASRSRASRICCSFSRRSRICFSCFHLSARVVTLVRSNTMPAAVSNALLLGETDVELLSNCKKSASVS
jgi:hypothetical protein